MRNDGQWAGCSRSLNVTDFGADWKPVSDILLVNNINSCPHNMHHFQVIAAYSFKFKLSPLTGVPCLNSLLWGEHWTMDDEILPQVPQTSLYHVVHNISWYTELLRCESPVWQMDRQTDERIDRIAITIALDGRRALIITTSTPVIRTGIYPHMPIVVTGQFVTPGSCLLYTSPSPRD